MTVYLLDKNLQFPSPDEAEPSGLLAVGADLSTDRLLLAYQRGIFPWYNKGEPILWWSPDPRCVIYPGEVKISRSMRNILNRNHFSIKFDHAFGKVIRQCRSISRTEPGTWINSEMIRAYEALHELGYAHSVEAYADGRLAGGLYGVSLGGTFFGESMFSIRPNASKYALICLAKSMGERGMNLIDCQLYNPHLGSLGATEIGRSRFLKELSHSLSMDTRRGSWADEQIWPCRNHGPC